jgi:hypothetical protein
VRPGETMARTLLVAVCAVLLVVLLSVGGCAQYEMRECSKLCGTRGVRRFTEVALPGATDRSPLCECNAGDADGGGR